jgi:hypothetical protein
MDHGRPLIKIDQTTYRGTADFDGVLWQRVEHLLHGGGVSAYMNYALIAHDGSMEE